MSIFKQPSEGQKRLKKILEYFATEMAFCEKHETRYKRANGCLDCATEETSKEDST